MSNWPEGGSGRMFHLVDRLADQMEESAGLEGLADIAAAATAPETSPPPWSRACLCSFIGTTACRRGWGRATWLSCPVTRATRKRPSPDGRRLPRGAADGSPSRREGGWRPWPPPRACLLSACPRACRPGPLWDTAWARCCVPSTRWAWSSTLPKRLPLPSRCCAPRRRGGSRPTRGPARRCAVPVTNLRSARSRDSCTGASRSSTRPELDHKDLGGWGLGSDWRDRFVLLILRGESTPGSLERRVAVTRDLLKDEFAAVREVTARGERTLARVMSLVQYGDFLSCHVADLRGVDPVPVDRITSLRQALATGPAT
jgi:hypothetical protein